MSILPFVLQRYLADKSFPNQSYKRVFQCVTIRLVKFFEQFNKPVDFFGEKIDSIYQLI